MDQNNKLNQAAIISPQPKRYNRSISDLEFFDIKRPQSCESEQISTLNELIDILGINNFSNDHQNISPLFKRFSSVPPERDQRNPIIDDQKFKDLEFSLSTSEDSNSDSEFFAQSN